METPRTRIETQAVHAGEPRPGIAGAVVTPIFQTAMYEYQGEQGYHNIRYIRLNNTPNHKALHDKLATLEGGETAIVAGSGMAAVSAALLSILSQGDHVIAQDCLYGGTYDLITKDLPALGVTHSFVDAARPETWKAALRPRSKLFYCESITNPLMRVPDLKAAPRFAKEHGLVSMIDNTFATPVNFRPIAVGFDLVMHSATKYLNGHSDLVAGALVGRGDLIDKALHKLNHFGGTLDPHACFLLSRGLKTLPLRVRFQNESALRVAKFFQQQPEVAAVSYPGLETSPDFKRARDLFSGFGGMLSFELRGGVPATEKLLGAVTIPIIAPSLGGPETLLTRPALTSHAGLSAEERRAMGINDGLVRMSIGLEATEDLIEDLKAALKSI
jgi:cystathionine beta-lyase/cystathionine gamma-synthase